MSQSNLTELNNDATTVKILPETATIKDQKAPSNEKIKKSPVMLNIKQNLLMNQVIGIYALHNGLEADSECKRHNDQYKEDLRAFETWALKMFDSSSKIQSTILGGNLIDFGGFDQCLAIHEETDSGLIDGKHCIVEIKPSEKIMKIVVENFRNISMHRLADLTGGAGVSVKWAICIPDSCSASDVEEHFSRALEGITEGVDAQITVRNASCVSKNTRRPFSQGDYATMIIFAGCTALAIFSTLYDLHCIATNHEPHQLLIAFSIYTNTKHLIKPPKSGEMGAIYGLRFLTMSWIICGHRFFMTMFFPVDNTLDILDWMTEMTSMVVVGGTFSVDTFFFISGLLVSFVFLKHMENAKSFNLPIFWIHRYLRLTPSYGMTALVYGTILYHFGNGPLWNDLMDLIQAPCYNHWWSVLLYLQNYINPGELCIVQTWYLMCDTQLYMLSPLILLPLVKFPTYGMIQLVVLTAISIMLSFNLAWKHQYRGGMPVTNALLKTDYFRYHYISTHTRASPWLIGAIFGYIIYKTQNKKVVISKATSLFLWIAAITTMLSCVFGAYPFQQPERPYDRFEASIYLALSRAAWSLAIAWILFACIHGYGGLVNKFLSLNLFQVWGRLSYNMYLLHILIQYAIGGNERIQTHFQNLLSIHIFFGDLIYTTVLSYIFALFFESPIMVIDRIRKKVKIRR
ncbi:O-acyltransferase like protein-like [Chrysoperla carnea]|uniref:O-acyltransferase like protein-like n=1 Tax=Chrysoperla carnea TaxID=189513 RepID=UPI001D06D81D|nr:O-acyltransferase like protein-like [Chrysoperla carnea]